MDPVLLSKSPKPLLPCLELELDRLAEQFELEEQRRLGYEKSAAEGLGLDSPHPACGGES